MVELGNGTSGLFSKLPNFCEPNHNDDERQNFNRLHIQLSSQDISHISHLNTIHIYPCPVFCLFFPFKFSITRWQVEHKKRHLLND